MTQTQTVVDIQSKIDDLINQQANLHIMVKGWMGSYREFNQDGNKVAADIALDAVNKCKSEIQILGGQINLLLWVINPNY